MSGLVLDLPRKDAAAMLEEARRQQHLAADPSASAWVSANAGTGKTYVLVLRVLKLLLSGAPIESILCLTFTKAAAAEMANRLIARLGRWAALSDTDLASELTEMLGRAPSGDELADARCLFAKLLDAPGGLKIMTIHAFCDRVLRRFPLEAGVPPSFVTLTEEEQHALTVEASEAVLEEVAEEEGGALGEALKTVVAHAGEDQFQNLLAEMIRRQRDLRALIRAQDDDDSFVGIETMLRRALGVGRDDTAESLIAEQAATAPDSLIARALAMLRGGKKTDEELAGRLAGARGKADTERVAALTAAFLIKEGEPRADRGFITKALREANPGLADELCQARDDFAALECRRRALQIVKATAALIRLADAVIQRYETEKIARGAIDFDGLIDRTAALFQRSDAAAWVLYRLDADIGHILVDEAQDTSPEQWRLIEALTGEFFAGDGAGDRLRTLFAVGDEKQSIYGFQGADPRQFAEAGRGYAARARSAQEPWMEVPLALSFRSTSVVLEAVDLVFADRGRISGLTAEARLVRHFAHRQGEAGQVEIWPVIKPEPRDAAPAWEPFAESAGAALPAVALASQIARQIRHWLDSGQKLASLGRPIRPSDILILVRKRAPFAAPMVRALKNAGIPVAGADRMKLTEQIAVMDLMALGDSLLLPEDDLTLAALLKSPIFGFDDDDLFAIGHGREGSLWDALMANAENKPAYAEAGRQLQVWRGPAQRDKPFDFYMTRLEGDALRKKLLARLGPDAADPIDEFLNLALAFEATETPTLQGFLHWLRISEAEIKRDMDAGRDEVRVMTVHGAKGLEANIVFLADACSAPSNGRRGIGELPPPPNARPGTPSLPVWLLTGSRLVPEIRELCDEVEADEREEYQRLLYVAMTRARDRLYVTGFEGQRARDKNCWYDLICDGLASRLDEVDGDFGLHVKRMECEQTASVKAVPAPTANENAAPLPGWHVRAVSEPHRRIVVNPSRLVVPEPAMHGAKTRPRDEALMRGRLAHRLLEQLPQLPPERWEQSASAFLKAEAKGWSRPARDSLQREVIRILTHDEFGELFGPASRAEVPLMAELPPLEDGAPPVTISGQVDRLLVSKAEILILDFKSGAGAPERVEETPGSYLAQLAAYRLALARLFPDKALRAALLWTEAPRLVAVPSALLDRGECLLYESVNLPHLD